MEIAGRKKIPVIEDACQAHLAEWRGKKVGTYGLAGGFSFQSSKNLNCAEGGAIVTNDESFAKTCYSFHNQGQGGRHAAYNPGVGTRGANMRLTEAQNGKRQLSQQITERYSGHYPGEAVRRHHGKRVSPVYVPLQ